MSIHELNAITLEVIENQRRAAHAWVAALQSANQRAYGKFDEIFKDRVVANTPLLSAELREQLVERQSKASGTALQGITRLTSGLDKGVDTTADAAVKAVSRLEERADRADGKLAGKALDVIGRASLPAAKLSRNVSGRVADGVAKIAERLVVEEEVVAPAAKPARKARTITKARATTRRTQRA